MTLAFGIGANAAIFSVVDGVLLRPLAFPDAGELVRITADLTKTGRTDVGLDTPQLSDYRRRTDLFQGVAGVYPINANLTNVDQPERIEAQLVSADFFTVLGVDAAVGRVFGSSDGMAGNAPLVVISDSLWRRRFGAELGVVGRAVRLDNDLYTIVGVLSPAFRYPGATLVSEPEVFVPAGFADTPFNAPARGQFQILGGAIARLAPRLPFSAATQRLRDLGATLSAAYPPAYAGSRGWVPRLVPLRDDVVGSVRPALVLLMAAVGAVLLIACVNVANLLLARASARHREFAVRASLGATRGRLIRQVLTESVLLALAGAATGLSTLWLLKGGLVNLVPAGLPRAEGISVDERVLAFTVVLSVATGLVFGLWPAFRSSLASPHDALRDAGRSNAGSLSGTRVRNVLVVTELAVALALLVVAALVGRAFLELYRLDSGFTSARVLTAQLWMPVPNDPKAGPYFSHDQRVAFMRRSLEAIRGIPGVVAAGWTSQLPVSRGAASVNVLVEGAAPESAATNSVEQTVVTDGYFEALQIPRLAGRVLAPSDDARTQPVVVVSASFARRYLPNGAAVGRRVHLGSPSATPTWLTIVGVVGDVHDLRPGIPPRPQLYRCLWQTSNLSMALVVRTPADPMASARLVTAAIRSADAELPTYGLRALNEVMSASLEQRRFAMVIVGVFAGVALGLAAMGIYGVLSYLVEQRRVEIGVRMALGASPKHVLRLVIGRGLWLVAIGELTGLVGALGAGRAVAQEIAGVTPFNPTVFGGIAALLAVVAVSASCIPAWRAIRIDPLRAIRQE